MCCYCVANVFLVCGSMYMARTKASYLNMHEMLAAGAAAGCAAGRMCSLYQFSLYIDVFSLYMCVLSI
jgi:hypothetical protein